MVVARALHRPTFLNGCVSVAFLALASLFCFVAFQEARVFFTLGQNPEERFQNLVADQVGAGISPYSQRFVLDSCVDAMVGTYGRLQPAAEKKALRKTCTNLALNYASATPTFAYAWYVAARASAETGDFDAFNDYLEKTYITSPSEGWLAELRLQLSEEFLDYLSPRTRLQWNSDLALALESDASATKIAIRMITHPDFRDRVMAVAEQLSAATKERIILKLNNLDSRSGG